MSARNKFDDVERVREIQQASLEIMTTMHRGLSEICKAEVSLDGGIAMKAIAEQTLLEVSFLALGLSPKGEPANA
jgi:hypothetical protein